MTRLGALAAMLATCGPRQDVPLQGVVSYDERQLAFELTGRLLEVKVAEGAALAAGAVVARLDDSLDRAALVARQSEAAVARDQLTLLRRGARGEDLRALEARLTSARAQEALLATKVARSRQMFQGGAFTRAALDEVEAQHTRAESDRRAIEENLRALRRGARDEERAAAEHRLQAVEAAVRMQEERLARHQLRVEAPGELLAVHLHAGEVAGAGVPVLTIADTSRPYADLFVPQPALANVQVGDAVSASVDGITAPFSGRVERIERRTEYTPRYLFSPEERSHLVVRVRVRLDDPKRQLHAGVPVFARLQGGGQ